MKKILLSVLIILAGTWASAQEQEHTIDIHNGYCNGFYVVFYATSGDCSGGAVGQSDPIYVPPHLIGNIYITFSGSTVTGGPFTWAGGTGPSGSWYISDAYIYNPCGITPGFGCNYPYDEVWTGCPALNMNNSNVTHFDLSTTCPDHTDEGCYPCDEDPNEMDIRLDFSRNTSPLGHYNYVLLGT